MCKSVKEVKREQAKKTNRSLRQCNEVIVVNC